MSDKKFEVGETVYFWDCYGNTVKVFEGKVVGEASKFPVVMVGSRTVYPSRGSVFATFKEAKAALIYYLETQQADTWNTMFEYIQQVKQLDRPSNKGSV